ncbi:glycosyltransferase family 39 protein [Nocardia sp. alder85J]|uniref:glycosyltransferase family 39 protein n=1 Tax=Nocardia sp. alder85J TaxID=2862949 RepID=UPI001CD3E890|nr:glycosyltransferase family 39 protein [Nocardia sp. alder85J]MCX4092784.1 glycosyltransferase family 39 protein [Nocardia sp. alder85J]
MTDVVDRARETVSTPRPPLAVKPVALVATLAAAVLLFSASRYGYFGDELYFLAAGRRPSWGYADQGPVLPLLARLMDTLAPGSYLVLRLPAVALTVAAIVVCAMLTREFGGGAMAQALAAAGYATSPFLLLQGALLTTNAVDTVLWVIISWLVARWVRTRDDRLLVVAAVITAIDIQVKWLVPFLWIALAVAAVLCGPRGLVLRPALWAGGALAVLLTVPELLWQHHRGWPEILMTQLIGGEQGLLGGRLMFVPMTLELAGWLAGPLLICGLVAFLFRKPLRPYRFLGVAWILLELVFMITGGRIYYSAGLDAVAIAAGAVAVTAVLALEPTVWRRLVSLSVVGLGVWAAAYVLRSTPWLPADRVQPPRSDAEAAIAISVYGKFGWPELAAAVVDAYRELPEAERAGAVIIADTYWQASALDQLGRDRLPPIYSPSRGWGYFGAPPDDATVYLMVGGYEAVLRNQFHEVDPVGRVDTRLGFPGNTQQVTLWRCTAPRHSWDEMWPIWMHL